MTKKILLLFALLIWIGTGIAQVPSNPIGINPPSLKWQQIHTDKVQVIFPKGNEKEAQRVANVVHYLADRDNASIGDKQQKVTILLQNQTVIPNGFVTVGPFRSEFYLTPPQFNCTTDWLDILAIHEYRHVQQFGNGNHGITNFFKSILGSWTWGGFTSTALPRWFFEGDAVGMETALTSSGRGRLPAFDMEYRALRLNDIDYTYEKASAGSLKDFVPDWYSLGYYLVTHARKHYGKDIWNKVVKDATAYKGIFYPLSSSLKRHTGLNTRGLYQQTFEEMDSLWKGEAALDFEFAEATQWNTQKKRTITHYNNPQFWNNNSLVVEKRGFDENPTYYQLDSEGSEARITQSGRIVGAPNSTLSIGGGKLCWSEYDFDIRWDNRTFSVIRVFDRETYSKAQLTNKSKYFSPALDETGRKIVAVATDEEQNYNLHVLSAASGVVTNRIPNPDNWFYMYPRWVNEDQIVVVGQKGEINELQLIDVSTGQKTAILPPTIHQITHPFSRGEYIYFSAAYSGVNNIYAVKPGESTFYRITNDMLGAFQPAVSPDESTLAYSSFSPEGYNIMKMELDRARWQPLSTPPEFGITYYENLAEQEGGSIIENVPNKVFKVKKFNKLSGIINPHSVLPIVEPPLFGASILSDNKFSTLSAEGNVYYNVNEDEWTYTAGLRYAEFFPILSASYARVNRSSFFTNLSALNDTTIVQADYIEEWTENRVSAGLAIPMTFTKGNAFHRLDLIGNYQGISINPQGNFDTPANVRRDSIVVGTRGVNRLSQYFRAPLESTNFNALDLRLLWRSLDRRARQHINPRWGLVVDGRYRTTLGTDQFDANVFQLRGDIYFPGFARTHSFFINTMMQSRDYLDNYRFPDFFVYPRGYNSILADNFYKVGLNYTMPLWYPDVGIGSLAFVKRVRANFFYDFGRAQLTDPFDVTRNVRSLGIDLGFDVRVIRLLDVDFGLRYSYLLDENLAPGGQQHQFDFILLSIGG